MKYIIIINILAFFLILGCRRADIVLTNDYVLNKNTGFLTNRDEGVDSPEAFPDYGIKIGSNLSEEQEKMLILNKWQEH